MRLAAGAPLALLEDVRGFVLSLGVVAWGCEAPNSSKDDPDDGSGTAVATGASTLATRGDDAAEAGASDATADAGDDEDDGAATGGGGGESGGGGGSGGGGETPLGLCAQPCEAAADCCPPLALGCPGADYPNNWSCVDGACMFGGCESDADCDGLLGLGPEECHPVAGVPTCVATCDGGGCALGTQCVGEADDDTTFCAAPADAPCESDDDCAGAGVCELESGTCRCSDDTECAPADMICTLPKH